MPRRDRQESLAKDNLAAALRSRVDRDIATDYPPPGDLARRASCERNLRRFCEVYFPVACNLPWSESHLEVIDRMQSAVLDGGLFALAMARGSGKTTLSVRAVLWALLYGHRRFVCLVAATEHHARALLNKHLKCELVLNEALIQDFRQVCYPLVRLEGNARKAGGQLFDGRPTRLEWTVDALTFPAVPDWACDGPNVSGSTISVAGLTGALRGQAHTLPSGEVIRPELVILDDVQTRESAMSPSQSAERLRLVNADVLGMAGPRRKIAAVMPCTVIRSGDVADTLLDRGSHPQWQGLRFKMLVSLPTNEKLWDEYARIRAEALRKTGTTFEATAFYQKHQAEMDAGAVAGWPARHNHDEISAVQHAMNLKIDDPESFEAEFQNSPTVPDQEESAMLTPEQIANKCSGIPRGVMPVQAEHVTCFIDVHDSLLYYVVAAWSGEFTGWVIDYGTLPDQKARYFAMRKPRKSLAGTYRGAGREGAIRAGLVALTDSLLSRTWEREDGAAMRIERCLIDAGYVPDTVLDVCRHSTHAAILMPSRGVGIGAAGKPMSEYDRKRGDRIGFNWMIPKPTGQQAARYFRFDSNYWKTFIQARLATPLGDVGCLSLFGHSPDEHRLIADHLVAEVPIKTSGQGRTVQEWRHKPDRPDNHWLDCITGCAAAASLCGAALPGAGGSSPPSKPRKRVNFAELQRQARAKYGYGPG
jgi:hypothetical protein